MRSCMGFYSLFRMAPYKLHKLCMSFRHRLSGFTVPKLPKQQGTTAEVSDEFPQSGHVGVCCWKMDMCLVHAQDALQPKPKPYKPQILNSKVRLVRDWCSTPADRVRLKASVTGYSQPGLYEMKGSPRVGRLKTVKMMRHWQEQTHAPSPQTKK